MMERYSEYKDSGVKWLGEIPSHWEVFRNKDIFHECKKSVGKNSNNYTLLSLSKKGVVIRNMDDGGKFPAEFDTYKVVEPGDFIFCFFDVDETPRAVGLSSEYGMITGAYTVLRQSIANSQYLYYYYLSIDDAKALKPLYTGLRKTVPLNAFMSMQIFLPPKAEQDAIVRYLDTATSEIDKAIAMQQKMIDLLNERKQIIIQNAVTKGLDENVEMKESGVEWIGRIPKHWEVNPLRKYLKVCSKRNMPDAQLLSVTREEGVIVRNIESKEENHNYIPDDLSNYKYVQKGQFVINKMKSWQGSYGVSNYDGIVSPAYFVYDLMYYNKEYFSLAIRSKKFSPFFSKYSKGIRIDQWDLMPEALKIIPFLEPPVEEQNAIVHFLEDIIPRINDNITNCQRQITLLQERKQIIINEVVTGKVRVS